ncbi:MAG: hypothetical protein ACT6S0_18915 [Roseateles sp.]|uniref:hypothetical protein n=1 Tax=Roseateles sp. TaxID=1971397 RepID=UPI0040358979
MADEATLIKKLAEQLKRIESLRKDHAKLDKETDDLDKKIKAMQRTPVFKLTGFVAAYTQYVKDTDGLISVMPSCLKAIQTAENSATVASVAAAVKAIAEQQKAALKSAGADASKKKAAVQFNKDLDKMSGKLEALL